jgi:hypothetical protein
LSHGSLTWLGRWVETKGKTLEEIDALIDGIKHSDVPDLEKVLKGQEIVDETLLRGKIHSEVDEKN